MRQHAGVFTANFSSNLLWQNCFAPKKSAFCAEPRRVAAGILDVCQGGATTGLRETRLLRRMFSCGRRPKAGGAVFVSGCGVGFGSRGSGLPPLPDSGVSVVVPLSPVELGGVSGEVGVSVVFVPVVGCWPAVALSPVLSLGFAASSTGAATTSSFGCSMTACLISTTVELEMGEITTLGCCGSVIWL